MDKTLTSTVRKMTQKIHSLRCSAFPTTRPRFKVSTHIEKNARYGHLNHSTQCDYEESKALHSPFELLMDSHRPLLQPLLPSFAHRPSPPPQKNRSRSTKKTENAKITQETKHKAYTFSMCPLVIRFCLDVWKTCFCCDFNPTC